MTQKNVLNRFFIVCSQTSCSVPSHFFIDRTCARESTFFVSKLMARATNHKTIVLITNLIGICIIYYRYVVTILSGLLRWKIEMHTKCIETDHILAVIAACSQLNYLKHFKEFCKCRKVI